MVEFAYIHSTLDKLFFGYTTWLYLVVNLKKIIVLVLNGGHFVFSKSQNTAPLLATTTSIYYFFNFKVLKNLKKFKFLKFLSSYPL